MDIKYVYVIEYYIPKKAEYKDLLESKDKAYSTIEQAREFLLSKNFTFVDTRMFPHARFEEMYAREGLDPIDNDFVGFVDAYIYKKKIV